ncbi:hypothetical protein PsorP6_003355 [Peronosclerospora sorghi]|uniref:Uncharacterized protein n=1 Tax=Peronosclerospora sorghi TaxID=230839 RepID=A0ACC0VQ28_9STRA|nr:hypothetical protein PsorP6_003355 [Peronosclerospora sorghi]
MFGGQYVPRKIDRARSIQVESIGPLPPPPSENNIVPWSNDITITGDDVEDNDDSEEPDPKRLRLTDGYDIALAVMDVPRTYNEAMASPQDYKWKEAIQSAFPSRNPNVFGQRLEELKDGDMVDIKRYRELIGSMLYIANGTRPDICVSICELSQHLEVPKPAHMKAAIRVLRYLAGTSKFGLCYYRNDTTMIIKSFTLMLTGAVVLISADLRLVFRLYYVVHR